MRTVAAVTVAILLSTVPQASAEGWDRETRSIATVIDCQASLCTVVEVVQTDVEGQPLSTAAFIVVFDEVTNAVLFELASQEIDPSVFTIDRQGTTATLVIADTVSLAWTATDDFQLFRGTATTEQDGVRTRSKSESLRRAARVSGFVGPLEVDPSTPLEGALQIIELRDKCELPC